MSEYQISVVIATWNRADLLSKALAALTSQESGSISYRVIIVDNNSKDHTRQVVKDWAARASIPIEYLFEPKQGVSYARNAAIAYAREPILAFTDDDVCVSPNWVASVLQSFGDFSYASFIGGKVLPLWDHGKPGWASERLEGLATQDYGGQPFDVTGAYRRCLISANLACRRELFDEVGVFAPELQRVEGSIGSMEDDEFEARAVAAGRIGVYDPRLLATVSIQPDRLRKQYHRRWHFGHGAFLCKQKDPFLERSSKIFLGVPGHMYRAAASDLRKWMVAQLAGKPSEAFSHEVGVYRFLGFVYARVREQFGRT
jgi:glycosyltransferase involved in cell wall biosynthesis